jgi:hypothetical protein
MKIKLKKLAKWVGRRLKERSTYIGISAIAVAVGAPVDVIGVIGKVGQVATVILGSGLIAATTSEHPPIEEHPEMQP